MTADIGQQPQATRYATSRARTPTPSELRRSAVSLVHHAESSAAHVAATHQLIGASSLLLETVGAAILRHRRAAIETALAARLLATGEGG
ncbi:MAG TPA: hypothetical protein VH482_18315 [Thermomicrobiales bacterium]|jgi:hypothetical protein